MFVELELINPTDRNTWDKLILSFQDYSFFHSSAWAKVLVDTYDFKPLYWQVTQNNNVVALLPCMEVKGLFSGRRCVSLPFSDYCGPLVGENIHLMDLDRVSDLVIVLAF